MKKKHFFDQLSFSFFDFFHCYSAISVEWLLQLLCFSTAIFKPEQAALLFTLVAQYSFNAYAGK